MALSRPAAHRGRVPDWRRSGDESYWESFTSKEEPLPKVSHPSRARRPQSAIEGRGQLDTWLENLRTLQSEVRTPVRNPTFTDRITSMPLLGKQKSYPSFSTSSSSCGTSSLCESSPCSQDFLQTGILAPPTRRGSWEKAHIMQSPKKEEAQLSCLSPVKVGWLPVQRRVMMVASDCSQNQSLDDSVGQVKLKPPITPSFQRNDEKPRVPDAVVEGPHTSPRALGVKTWRIPDQASPVIKEVPEKPGFPAERGDRCVGRQAPRTGWKANRVSAFPEAFKSDEFLTATREDPDKKPSLMKTSGEPLKHPPLHRTSAHPRGHHTLLQGTNSSETFKSHAPLQRTSSVLPIKATVVYGTSNGSDASHIQSNPAVTQNKPAFSSITISSRKVSRSASLPGSNSSNRSPSPALNPQPMDPNSRQVRVQRKPTIVKVTEERVISSSGASTSQPGTPPVSYALDTVVYRRKATIIKVTEHEEKYSPAKIATRTPEQRHSYTEGLFKDTSTWTLENGSAHNTSPSHNHLNSVPNSSIASNPFTPSPQKHGTLHKSTLSLFVSSPPAISPSSFEVSSKAAGLRSDRLKRPLSCYGNLIGHTEPSTENAAQSAARKWSFGPPQGTHINPVNFNRGFISPGKAAKEAGQPVADTFNPGRDEKKRMPPSVGGTRRASPSLTLIKAPDPHKSEEEVLALNAAAIIANIKLQRQLSKKKTSSSNSEKDSAASPQGNTAVDEMKYMKLTSEQSKAQHQKEPHTEYVPLRLDQERSSETVSLQQALQSSRPDFISRSQRRVRTLERKARERRERSGLGDRQPGVVLGQKKGHSVKSTSVNGNLFKPRHRGVSGREMPLGSRK